MTTFDERKIRTIVPLDDDPDFSIAPVSPFCPLLTFSTTVIDGSPDVDVDGMTLTVTNVLNESSLGVGLVSDEIFNSVSDVVKVEHYFDAVNPTGTNQFFGFFLTSNPFDIIVGEVVFVGVQTQPSTGLVFNPLSGSPVATGVSMIAGSYKIGVNFDTSNGLSTWQDSEGNGGSLGISPYYLAGFELRVANLAAIFLDDTLDSVSSTLNVGTQAFELPLAGIGYCDTTPAAFCSFFTLVEQLFFGDIIVESQFLNNFRLFSNASGSGLLFFGSNESATTQTETLHFEYYHNEISTPANPNTSAGIAFIKVPPPFTPPTDLIASIIIVPPSSIVIDGIAGSPLATGVTMTAGSYKIALDLNTATSVTTWKDSEGNSGTTTTQSFNNLLPIYYAAGANVRDFDLIDGSFNAGFGEFQLPTIGAKGFCEV